MKNKKRKKERRGIPLLVLSQNIFGILAM